MTKQSLDERIEALIELYDRYSEHDEYHVDCDTTDGHVVYDEIELHKDIRQLIRDVLTEVLPEKDNDSLYDFTQEYGDGWNDAIDQTLTNLNNLLGEKQ